MRCEWRAVFMISLATIWLKTGLMPRWLVIVTYVLALGILFASDISMWITLAFPAWVLVVSVLLLMRAGVIDLRPRRLKRISRGVGQQVSDDFDVIVVGSGPAGCTAAIMLGRNGLRVALLEAHRDVNHYKRLCTHSIRSSALPTLRRLGLDTTFDELGGVHQHEKAWTRFGGFTNGSRNKRTDTTFDG